MLILRLESNLYSPPCKLQLLSFRDYSCLTSRLQILEIFREIDNRLHAGYTEKRPSLPEKRKVSFYFPHPGIPGTRCLKQFPTPGPEGKVTGGIEPCINRIGVLCKRMY